MATVPALPDTLQGLHILVTRPLLQARQTRDKLQEAGATVSLFPLLEILPTQYPQQAQQYLTHIDHYYCIIFISHNAVKYAFQLGGESFHRQLRACKVGAIGKKTALALRTQQINVDFLPDSGFTSEDFLALSGLQSVNQQSLLIIRGEGGRELLAETLRERGANVHYADVYRRACPVNSDINQLKQRHQRQALGIISLTSSESMHNLLSLADDNTWLKRIPLLVGSQRIAADARKAGFSADIVVATDPGDQSMQQALIQWRQERKK